MTETNIIRIMENKKKIYCDRCGADEEKYFYKNVCRRCIGLQVFEEPKYYYTEITRMNMSFDLTDEQKIISKELLHYVNEGNNVYLEAVCGAGKTEMSYALIKDCINQKKRICWAIPRREVVMELYLRMSQVFPEIKVVRVCEGYTDDIYGDLIICTTHQLFRYYDMFDVLIIDEPDAFPFMGNEMLQHIAKKACKGVLVYLSATFEPEVDFKTLQLSHRPSGKPLPLPTNESFFNTMKKLVEWKNEHVLIFTPTIKKAKKIAFLLRCPYITSQSEDKHAILSRFRERGGYLVCTTILERGVTFKDCFVVVLYAGHDVFNKASLVQIAGRAQRGLNPKKGEVIFWGKSPSVTSCLKYTHHHRNIVLTALKI